jgi:hypothetical protein
VTISHDSAPAVTVNGTVTTGTSGLVNFVDFETGDFSQGASHVGGNIVTNPALAGMFSLQLLRNNSVANFEIRQSGTTYYNLPTTYYSFLFQYASLTGEGGVINFQDTMSGYKAAIHLSASGKLLFFDIGGVNAIGIGSTTLNPNQTYTIAVKIPTGSNAAWELRINGVVELSGTGNFGSKNNGSIKLGGNNAYTTNFYYDNVSINSQGFSGGGAALLLKGTAALTDNAPPVPQSTDGSSLVATIPLLSSGPSLTVSPAGQETSTVASPSASTAAVDSVFADLSNGLALS